VWDFALAMFLDLYFKTRCVCVQNVFLLQKKYNILCLCGVELQHLDLVFRLKLALE